VKKSQLKKVRKPKETVLPPVNDDLVLVPRFALGQICESAEARMDQWNDYVESNDAYANDCIYECKQDEAKGIAKLLKDCLKQVDDAVAKQPRKKK